MSRKINLYRDYYDEGFNLYKKRVIEINSGVTVLVGCNGIGKTTLLKQLKQRLKSEGIPCLMFDNLTDGGSHAVSEAGFNEDFAFIANAVQSSEGENIVMNIANFTERVGEFVRDGMDSKQKKKDNLMKCLSAINGTNTGKEEKEIPKERWILFDAIDSGLSVDNIVDIKEQLFDTILKYNFGNEIYIVVSANEYEMARGEKCFDVYNGKYVKIKDYEDYRNLVLQSKEWKYARTKVK